MGSHYRSHSEIFLLWNLGFWNPSESARPERLEPDPDIDVQYYAQRALLLCLGPILWVNPKGTAGSQDRHSDIAPPSENTIGGKKKVCFFFFQLTSRF